MLYPQLLQGDFDRLPTILREFHTIPGGGRASGTVAVKRRNPWLAQLVGFPPSGDCIPLRLEVLADEDREVWTRRFGDSVLQTVQSRQGNLLLEKMGPLRLFFRVFADAQGMRFESQRARLWMIPLPLRVRAETRGGDSSWDIHVTVDWVGSYRGAMVPAA